MFFVAFYMAKLQFFMLHKYVYHAGDTDACYNAHLCQRAAPVQMCLDE